MSTGTAPGTETVAEKREVDLSSIFTVFLGTVTVLAGSLILFAASPTMSVEPFFSVSSVEPVTVIANIALGATIIFAGTAMSVPELDSLL